MNLPFCKSLVGIDPPIDGVEEILHTDRIKSTIIHLAFMEDIVDIFKQRHFETLNQIGVFYAGEFSEDGQEFLLHIKAFKRP